MSPPTTASAISFGSLRGRELRRARCSRPALYIADGHHRSAAALRDAQARGGEGAHNYFLACCFRSEMTILDYNRVLRDLNGRSPDQVLTTIAAVANIDRMPGPPTASSTGMLAEPLVGAEACGTRAGSVASAGDTASPQSSSNRFSALAIRAGTSGSISSAAGAGSASSSGWLRRRGGGRVRALSDRNARPNGGRRRRCGMPPKSTWFEPKLADGMVSHVLD